MADPETPVSGNERSGFHVPLQDASTQTTGWIYIRDSSTQTPENDLSPLEQPTATSETSEENRKRKKTNEQEEAHVSDVAKLPRTETCGKIDQFVSSQPGRIKPDLKDIISPQSHTSFESSQIPSNNQEFSKSVKSYSQNEELKVTGSLGNTENLKKDENIASNKNIFQIETATSDKSYTDVSKVTDVCSDDMLARQGSSRCHEDNSHSKELVENLQNVSPVGQRQPVETEKKEHTCLTCEKTIFEHVESLDGKDVYRCCHKCCRCLFICDSFESLQMHIFKDHTQPFYCDVCHINYSETGSHARGAKCEVCKQDFECKYQLEEHYTSAHKNLHETHCRICKKEFEEHNNFKNKVLYLCCFKDCEFQFNSTSSFDQHLSKHSRLKVLKCEVCGYYFKRPCRF